MVYVDGKGYELSQVMTIGEVPEQKEEDKTDGTGQDKQQTKTGTV